MSYSTEKEGGYSTNRHFSIQWLPKLTTEALTAGMIIRLDTADQTFKIPTPAANLAGKFAHVVLDAALTDAWVNCLVLGEVLVKAGAAINAYSDLGHSSTANHKVVNLATFVFRECLGVFVGVAPTATTPNATGFDEGKTTIVAAADNTVIKCWKQWF